MREEEGKAIVKKIVDKWSRVYINQVFFGQEYGNILQYFVEFSKPSQLRPIPEGTVKVYFDITVGETPEDYDIEFNFENESLKHRIDSTMREDMFQSWIDRVLENKHKIKQQLHLGTEFEYTRFVDKKGQPIDPFVPKFDIMKAKDLGKEYNKSQKINVESPRFIKTLERALVKLFSEADANNSGELTYAQFYNAFNQLPTYDLCENDIRTLLALADENANGHISWQDFIPVGIEAIKTFLARNKILAKQSTSSKEVNKETLKFVFDMEIQQIALILKRRFEAFDTDADTKEHSGKISFAQLREVLHGTSYLTIKEINLLLRDYVMKFGYEQIDYTNFAGDLYEVRFDLARSRIMDINIRKLKSDWLLSCGEELADGCWMRTEALRRVICDSKDLTLTPCEINLILGFARHREDGMIDVGHFADLFKEIVTRMFTIDARRRKAQLVQLGSFKAENVPMPEYLDLELFKVFRDFDENDKGFLEPLEFVECLQSFPQLGLKESEVHTIALSADIDGSGRIDYQEFMKYFKDSLFWTKFNNELQAQYDDEQNYAGLGSGRDNTSAAAATPQPTQF